MREKGIAKDTKDAKDVKDAKRTVFFFYFGVLNVLGVFCVLGNAFWGCVFIGGSADG